MRQFKPDTAKNRVLNKFYQNILNAIPRIAAA
jgi:hypothetical protein